MTNPSVPGATPRVVVIGGGRGLTATVRAARTYARHTTAVVATADDSGSTGRLRATMAVPALGDLRRCLVAMAGAEDTPLGRAFEYRFAGTDIDGHALGNLLLAGMTAVSGGVLDAVAQVSTLLGIDPAHAQALPATVEPVDLHATTVPGAEVRGQYSVSKTRDLARVALDPPHVAAPPAAVAAILAADQIVLGPGSLYTSILPVTLVPALHDALTKSQARVVYVANLEREDAETLGYDVAAHVAALVTHGVVPDLVLADQEAVHGGALPLGAVGVDVVEARLARTGCQVHDSDALGLALATLVP